LPLQADWWPNSDSRSVRELTDCVGFGVVFPYMGHSINP
jgi:hypothetical protein